MIKAIAVDSEEEVENTETYFSLLSKHGAMFRVKLIEHLKPAQHYDEKSKAKSS